jgi:nitrogen fixation protein NifT
MKIMIRKAADGKFSGYIAKKDLEEPVVAQDKPGVWGGNITLGNGWVFAMPEMPESTTFPITVDARRLSGGDD